MDIEAKTKWAKVVVIVNWIIFGLLVFLFVIIFFGSIIAAFAAPDFYSELQEEKGGSRKDFESAKTLMIIFIVIFLIALLITILIELALNILLTRAINLHDRRRCNIWLVINIIFFVFTALGLIKTIHGTIEGSNSVGFLVVDFVSVAWLGVSIFIIKSFRDVLGNPAQPVLYMATNPVA